MISPALLNLLPTLPADDAEAAAVLSTPAKTPKRDGITLRSLGGTWGLARAAAFRGWLLAASGQATQLGGVAATVLALIDGPGFDAAHPDVAGAVSLLADRGACSTDEADAVLYDVVYPCGGPVTADDVAAARAAAARRAAERAGRDRVLGVAPAWLNESYNPAASAGGPLPTFADFKAHVAALPD